MAEDIPAPRFFSLCWRLRSAGGAATAGLEREEPRWTREVTGTGRVFVCFGLLLNQLYEVTGTSQPCLRPMRYCLRARPKRRMRNPKTVKSVFKITKHSHYALYPPRTICAVRASLRPRVPPPPARSTHSAPNPPCTYHLTRALPSARHTPRAGRQQTVWLTHLPRDTRPPDPRPHRCEHR